jgi:predicted enzyme related to lactoylglutathione lyase
VAARTVQPMSLRGLSNLRFQTPDLDAAIRWYTDVLGVEPYFQRPGYAEFRVGDYQHELGIVETSAASGAGLRTSTADGPAGAVAYWHVDDVVSTAQRLVGLGATEHEPVRDFGGFVVASVVDPFGNIVGLMRSPHYLEVLERKG